MALVHDGQLHKASISNLLGDGINRAALKSPWT